MDSSRAAVVSSAYWWLLEFDRQKGKALKGAAYGEEAKAHRIFNFFFVRCLGIRMSILKIRRRRQLKRLMSAPV